HHRRDGDSGYHLHRALEILQANIVAKPMIINQPRQVDPHAYTHPDRSKCLPGETVGQKKAPMIGAFSAF
ncbi:MAG: hypothetical protein AAF660_09715, partial [Pseudomonadota bacterium]